MNAAGNHPSACAKALLAASNDYELKRPIAPKPVNAVTCADLTLLEREMKKVQEDYWAIEATYGEDMLNLVIATSYVARLVSNRRIARHLDENHPEILKEFSALVDQDGPRRRPSDGIVHARRSRTRDREIRIGEGWIACQSSLLMKRKANNIMAAPNVPPASFTRMLCSGEGYRKVHPTMRQA